MIVICDNCLTRVVPSKDRKCPACHCQIIEQADGLRQDIEPELEAIDQQPQPSKFDLIQCYHCSNHVFPTKDMTCPSCGVYSPSLNKLRYEHSIRKMVGRREVQKAYWLLLISFAVGSCLLFVPLSVLLVMSARKSYLLGRRQMAPNGFLLIAEDTRAPVLYLRSFHGDGSYNKNETLENLSLLSPLSAVVVRRTHEELLCSKLVRVGPVVAIGKPGETLPELGAARMYIPESHWQQTVQELMNRAGLIVLRVGESSGVCWEIDKILETVPPEKIVFYCRGRTELAVVGSRLPITISEKNRFKRFLHFDRDWNPIFSVGIAAVLLRKRLYRPS